MDSNDLLWKQYQQNVDLFKFYMGLLVQFNVFFYAITGAIISFVLAQFGASPIILWALLLPFIMSFAFSGFFIYGACLVMVLRKEVFNIRDALKLQAAPDLAVLSIMLITFAIIYLMIGVGCTVLLCKL